jgi:short subunit fatty acids transporter
MKLGVLIFLQNMNYILQNVKQQDGFCSNSVFSFPFDGIIKGLLETGLGNFVRGYFIKICDEFTMTYFVLILQT